MQKLINVLSLASFLVSVAVVSGGVYVYLNKDAMIERAKERVTKAATEAVAFVRYARFCHARDASK